MCRICRQQNPADSHCLDAAIVNLELVGFLNLILTRLWVTRQHGFKMPVSTLEIFFMVQSTSVTVRDTPETRLALGYQTPMVRIDHVITATPAVLREAVIEDLGDEVSTMVISNAMMSK
jgi:hypothetical protein